jgi:hypothetical protein
MKECLKNQEGKMQRKRENYLDRCLYGFSFQRFLQERKLKKASRESETAIMGPFKTREPSCLVAYVSMHRSAVSPQEVSTI